MLIIPFYNSLPGLRRSLGSICYDPTRYGLLIIDDGSYQPLEFHDINDVVAPDVAVKIIRLERNSGITAALNAGLEWLQAEGDCRYVARLDCGDLCDPGRFAKQVKFMDVHPTIDLVGSWVIFKDFSTEDAYVYTTPVAHKEIARGMHFRNLFIHPTILWRFPVMRTVGRYRSEFPHAEDYGFCYEIVKYGRVAVLPDYLVTCEINPRGLSLQNRRQQLKSRMAVVRRFKNNTLLSFLGIAKCMILLTMPYRWIYALKTSLYGLR